MGSSEIPLQSLLLSNRVYINFHFSSPTGGPLKAALVKYVLGYLFPDSEANSQHFYSDSRFQSLPDPMMKWVDKYTGSGKHTHSSYWLMTSSNPVL